MATRVPIRYGGTGANTAAGVRAALGVLSTSGGSFTGNLNVNSVIMANSRGVFGNSFQDHANSVGIDTSTVIVGAYANNDGPAEVMVVNKSNGSVAYAEFIALNDTANQEQGWISIGVNSSDYNDPEYTLTGPDDGYLLFEAPLGTAANGDLIIGTGSYGDKNRIVLAAGGFEPQDAQLLIAPANLKSASITQSRLNSNIAILTTSATHNFVANDVVIISSVGAPYDGTRTILAVTANTFNVSITSANVALANVSPAGEALEYLPFNKGTVELTAQLFVGENSKSTIETADITLAEGHAIPLGVVVNNDGPGQTVMFNKSNGALAFSEFIAHNDQGNVHQGWISMGINSSGYDDPEFPITKEDDGYLLFEAPAGTTGGGDLIIGTGTNGQTNRLIFAAEGFDEANAQMIITPDESVRISINTDASSSNTGALQIVGGVGVQGSMYVQGNQTIQGDLIVNGSQIIQSIENLAAAGPISLVSEGNIANTWDQGIVGTYAVSVGSVVQDIAFKEIANNTGIISTSNNHSFIVEDIVTIAGVDATFNGTHRITAVTANTLSFYLLAGNVSKTSSSGTATVDKTTKYTGLVKKASDGTWRLFSNLGSRPGFNTDLSAANLAYDSIIAGAADFRGTLKLGSPNTATISYTDNNARALTIPALSGDRTFAFIDQAQTFTAAQGFNSTVTATKFIPTGGDATGNGLYLPSANKVSISADGVERVAISASEMVVNDGSADYDFRVESDGVAHMLFVDGGTNTVGIGTNAPSANLHVVGTTFVTGNVGIGTSNTTSRLHVVTDSADSTGFNLETTGSSGKTFFAVHKLGFIRVRSSDTNGAAIHFWDNAGAKRAELSIGSDSKINWYSDALTSTWLTFDGGNGRVGVGTNAPAATLHVNESTGGIIRVSRLGTGGGIMQMEADGTDGTLTVTNNLKFVTAGSERMRVDTSGRVLIGVTSVLSSPFILQVLGNGTSGARTAIIGGPDTNTSLGGTAPILNLYNSNSTQNNFTKLAFGGNNTTEGVSINCENIDHTNGYGNMVFVTRGSTGYAERMRITSRGAVLVGTSSDPTGSAVQHFFSHAGDLATALVVGDATNTASISGIYIRSQDPRLIRPTNFPIHIADPAGTKHVTIMGTNAGGYVGIGTTSPSAKLEVAGDHKGQGFQWIQKALPYFYFGAGGITDEYLVLTKYYDGGGAINSSGIMGEIIAARGSTTSGNSTCKTRLHITSAYLDNYCGEFSTTGSRDFYRIDIITIDGVKYYAARGRPSGGESLLGSYFTGWIITDNSDKILTRVRASDANVTVVTAGAFYPAQAVTKNDNKLYFETNNVDRLVIDDNGNIGIGTTNVSPLYAGYPQKLYVKGSMTSGYWGLLTFEADGNTGDVNHGIINLYNSKTTAVGDDARIMFTFKEGDGTAHPLCSMGGVKEGSYQGAIHFNTRSATGTYTEKMRISAGGTVGIGITNPNSFYRLDVNGPVQANGTMVLSGDGGAGYVASRVVLRTHDNYRGTGIYMTGETSAVSNNTFFIGTPYTDHSYGLLFRYTANNYQTDYQSAAYTAAGTTLMWLAPNGAVNIPGSLSKGSGSFKIDHPLPEKANSHFLVHSFIEGPQADLIYSGKVQLSNGSATINIDTHARMSEGTFVLLCRDIRCFTTNETNWDAVRGSVSGNILTIECQNPTSNAMVSWMVIGERQDKHMIDTGWTDENGRVIVEPEKPTIEIQPPPEPQD